MRTMSNPEYDVSADLDPIAARAQLVQISDDRLFVLHLDAIVLGMRHGQLLVLTCEAIYGHRLAVRQVAELGQWPRRRRRAGPRVE